MKTLMLNLNRKLKILKAIRSLNTYHLFTTMRTCSKRNLKRIPFNPFLKTVIKMCLKKRFSKTEPWMIELEGTKPLKMNLKKNKFKMSHAIRNLRRENVYASEQQLEFLYLSLLLSQCLSQPQENKMIIYQSQYSTHHFLIHHLLNVKEFPKLYVVTFIQTLTIQIRFFL